MAGVPRYGNSQSRWCRSDCSTGLKFPGDDHCVLVAVIIDSLRLVRA